MRIAARLDAFGVLSDVTGLLAFVEGYQPAAEVAARRALTVPAA